MLIYLASPYSHPDPAIRQQRYEAVLKSTADLISRGFHVFSPITYIHSIVEHLMATKDETRFTDYYLFKNGEDFDTDMIRHCEAFWILTINGWKESIGVKVETELAKKLKLPISHVDIDGNIDLVI
jgi:hypothetical protein